MSWAEDAVTESVSLLCPAAATATVPDPVPTAVLPDRSVTAIFFP